MYLCAVNFGWTPDQVKVLSRRQLASLFRAGNEMMKEREPAQKPSTETDIAQFIQKHGVKG